MSKIYEGLTARWATLPFSETQHKGMLESQDGLCAVLGTPLSFEYSHLVTFNSYVIAIVSYGALQLLEHINYDELIVEIMVAYLRAGGSHMTTDSDKQNTLIDSIRDSELNDKLAELLGGKTPRKCSKCPSKGADCFNINGQLSSNCFIYSRMKNNLSKYGLTNNETLWILLNCKECTICGRSLRWRSFKGRKTNMVVDHSHNPNLTKRESIRGIICNCCNRSLGYMGDGNDVDREDQPSTVLDFFERLDNFFEQIIEPKGNLTVRYLDRNTNTYTEGRSYAV